MTAAASEQLHWRKVPGSRYMAAVPVRFGGRSLVLVGGFGILVVDYSTCGAVSLDGNLIQMGPSTESDGYWPVVDRRRWRRRMRSKFNVEKQP